MRLIFAILAAIFSHFASIALHQTASVILDQSNISIVVSYAIVAKIFRPRVYFALKLMDAYVTVYQLNIETAQQICVILVAISIPQHAFIVLKQLVFVMVE